MPHACHPACSAGPARQAPLSGRARAILPLAARCVWAVGLVTALASGAWAQSVALQGMLGSRALLMIDGGAPRSAYFDDYLRRYTSSGRISLPADGGGHFMGSGSINGRPVQFMVDTGASTVAMGVSDAERIGLAYRDGQPVRVGTANGLAQGWRVKLASVRIGDVEVYDVDAVVTPQGMPFVLLGNSYLNRFQMRRDNDQMVLERRY